MEDNAAVRIWFKKTQQEKGDSLTVGYISELWDFACISVTQNNLQELKEIWDQWDDEIKQLVYHEYGDLPYLIDVKVDKNLFRALAQCWNPAYSCFTFEKGDLVATVKDIYGLVIFPKALGHVYDAVSDLFDRLEKKKVEKVSYRVFSEDYSPLIEFVAIPRRDNIFKEKIWGFFGYASLLVLRQYRLRQLIPATKARKHRSIEEHLQVIPFELEIIKQDFRKKISDLEKRIEKLEEEKIQLGLDVDVQTLEAKKIKKGKNKAEEDLDSLKIDYKKLCLSMRTTGLGKTSKKWWQEMEEGKIRVDQWEKKFQDDRVAELERSLHQHRSCNSVIKLRASLTKIEKLKGKIEELEVILKNCELRVEFLETNYEHWKEQLQHSQGQTRDRDHIMGEALTQVREVTDHLQTLVVQADILCLRYKSESNRVQELAWLLRKVKDMSIRAMPYM
ncbi:hypothetical protein Golax_022557 [Gossypium laxum]|uniref:DUF7745 domain-containing protein n=1 Tax=Gossypium laxum TaxID=34288 RepID=A0A7J9B699_9ROSI|nr:hypothetical protein [Gossypium laxum]